MDNNTYGEVKQLLKDNGCYTTSFPNEGMILVKVRGEHIGDHNKAMRVIGKVYPQVNRRPVMGVIELR